MLRKFQKEYNEYIYNLTANENAKSYQVFAHRLSQDIHRNNKKRTENPITIQKTLKSQILQKDQKIQDLERDLYVKDNHIESLDIIIRGHEALNRDLINKSNSKCGLSFLIAGLVVGAILIYYLQ